MSTEDDSGDNATRFAGIWKILEYGVATDLDQIISTLSAPKITEVFNKVAQSKAARRAGISRVSVTRVKEWRAAGSPRPENVRVQRDTYIDYVKSGRAGEVEW